MDNTQYTMHNTQAVLHNTERRKMIFAIVNQKGGVGKTTTAAALTGGLHAAGYRVLAVDMDSQRNLSTTMRADLSGKSSLGLLTGEATAAEAIQHTEAGDIIPASKGLSAIDRILEDVGKPYKLREALEPIAGEYDYIIIDSPPALGTLSINAMTAADSIIITANASMYSLEGIVDLAETIQTVRKYCNKNLTIAGILLTQYKSRSTVGKELAEYLEKLAARLGTKIFTARIRQAVAIEGAQAAQKSIFQYAPRAAVTADYAAFIQELTGKEV